MGAEEPNDANVVNVTPLRVAPPASPELGALAERAVRVSIGVASLAAGFLTGALARSMGATPAPEEAGSHEDEPEPQALLPIVLGAGLELVFEAGRAGLRSVSAAGRTLAPWASFATSPAFVRTRLDRARSETARVDERWRSEQDADEQAGARFLQAVVPQVVNAALDQLDLTALVLERLDLDRVVDTVDLERAIARVDLDSVVDGLDLVRIVDRIDLEAIVNRIDIDEIVRRVDLDAVMRSVDLGAVIDRIDIGAIIERVDIQRIVDRVDLNAVASRIDIDAVAARVDVEAIVRRLDLTAIAQEVLDELDLPTIVRESTGTMANETVEGLRLQGMHADRFVARLRERLLGRAGDAESEGPMDDPPDGSPSGGSEP